MTKKLEGRLALVTGGSRDAGVGYIKGAARDLGPRGITVDVVQPGSIDTERNR